MCCRHGQEVSIVISPRGGGIGQDIPLTRGLGHLRTHSMKSVDSPMAPTLTASRLASSIPEAATPGTSVSNQVNSPEEQRSITLRSYDIGL